MTAPITRTATVQRRCALCTAPVDDRDSAVVEVGGVTVCRADAQSRDGAAFVARAASRLLGIARSGDDEADRDYLADLARADEAAMVERVRAQRLAADVLGVRLDGEVELAGEEGAR